MVVVTGGAGFVGNNFILDGLAVSNEPGHQPRCARLRRQSENLCIAAGRCAPSSSRATLAISTSLPDCCPGYRPRAIVNFAAESHVDRSIHGPETSSDQHRRHLPPARSHPRLLERTWRPQRISSFTSPPTKCHGPLATIRLSPKQPLRTQQPVLASKAASDHLVRAYHHTHMACRSSPPTAPTTTALPLSRKSSSRWSSTMRSPASRCPSTATAGRFATGSTSGPLQRHPPRSGGRVGVGETYNVGGWNEKPNLEVVHTPRAAARRTEVRAPTASRTRNRSPTSRTAPARPPLRHRRPSSNANSAGSLPKPSRPASARPCSGIWTIRPGCRT